jgi:hypothetical protein
MSITRDAARGPAGRGELLVRVGALVFAVGAVATLATVTPLLIGAEPPPGPRGPGWCPHPTAAYAVSMLMAVGFAIAAAGLLRSTLTSPAPPGGPPARRGTP